ncbi:MAG: hypothetical protein ABIT36_12055 [Steroidobacteraceae bacterium]
MRRVCRTLLLAFMCAGCVHSPLANLKTLNAELLSHDSATFTLERWCAAQRLADPAQIRAERVHDVEKPATAQQRQRLQVSAAEPLRYRRVRLRCGGYILSEADNWYVPSRLTPEMNLALDTSDVAFGRAVQALRFKRRTLAAVFLYAPPARIPPYVLRHTAVLTLPDGRPISEVVETYTSAVLERQ